MDFAERKKMGEIRRAELIAKGYIKGNDGIWRPSSNSPAVSK